MTSLYNYFLQTQVIMESFPGPSSDWQQSLEMLKSEDEMMVYQGAMELRDSLSYAQENQMQGFPTEQIMDILVKIVQRDPLTDLSNEVKFFAIQSLTTLMDIFPSLVNGLVNAGLVKGLVTVMESSVGFIDLTESCIKAMEKIVLENPPAILRSGAVALILQQMDFLEMGTQLRIFRIVQKIARHSSCESDFDAFIKPLLPFICMNLNIDFHGDQKKVEDISKIVCEIQDSFCMFYSPVSEFVKVGDQFNKLMEQGIYDIILEHVSRYAEKSLKIQNSKNGEEAMEIDDQIQSANQNQQLTHQSMLNFFKIMESASRYSHQVSNKIFGQSSLIRDLSAFMPHDNFGKRKQYNQEDFPLIIDAINLLNALFSDKDSQDGAENIPEDESKQSPLHKRILMRREYEKRKREYQLSEANREKICYIAENLLPRIFFVYETAINPQFRIKTLQVIDKVIALFDDELLKGFIEPNQFAHFIYQIIKSKHSSSIDVSLKITSKVLACSPIAYSVPFIREGVSKLIRDLSTEDQFKQFMGIGKDVDISDKSFDLDIHEVKEALHYTRVHNPDDHSMRDFYERRLLELVERQKHSGGPDISSAPAGLQKVLKAVMNKEAQDKKNAQGEQRQNIALAIIAQSQAILSAYFENPKFIEKLQNHSPQTKLQLEILKELTQISEDLCKEAVVVQKSVDEMANIRRLLMRVAEMLTLEDCAVTSYEFSNSNLLFALETLLTITPSQAKYLIDKRRAEETGEEMKRSDEIEMMEKQRNSLKFSKKESRCMVNRLKQFAHIILIRKSSMSPLQALIDINHKIISENDSFIYNQPGMQRSSENAYSGGFGSIFASMSTGQYGDYDHCINALRQLQKRVTVNLVYDPKKTLMKEGKASAKEANDPLVKDEENLDEEEDLEDSNMEDLADSSSIKNQSLSPKIIQKTKSHHPALLKLAASPEKDMNAIEAQKINQSKVFVKRNYLYNELKQIPVTVEQSSCLQILEDFLRNRIKTIDQVRGLKFDYGFGAGGPPKDSLFGSAFGGQYQSITQKILRKNLGNGARKLLDSANERLTKILNTGQAYKIKQKKKSGKRVKKLKDNSGDEMEGIEKADQEDKSNEELSKSDDHNEDSGSSDGYGDIEPDEEDEREMEADIERQRLLDLFVEELPDEILSSNIPEDQKTMLVKILTRQHAFMIDQLKLSVEDAEAKEGSDMSAAGLEDMYRLEQRLEDFQDTMMRVQYRFMDKQAELRDKKAVAKKQEEEKKNSEPVSDHEMEDLSEEPKSGKKGQKKKKSADKAKEQKEEESQPKLKIQSNDAEMIKPSEVSDSEVIDDAQIDSKPKESKDITEDEKKRNFEMMLEKEFEDQDRKIQQALEKEKERQKQGTTNVDEDDENKISEQTQEAINEDLEELIKQQGEDCDFEFFFEGKQIMPNHTIFEIVKESEQKRKKIERSHQSIADQLRVIHEKEAELKRLLKEATQEDKQIQESQINQLKKDSERLQELVHQLVKQSGSTSMKSGPPGFLSSINAHKIYFCIKDKSDEVTNLKRQRLDSLAELTNSALRRSRTRSEAVQDISSSSVNEFVKHILTEEFKVFNITKKQGQQGDDEKLLQIEDEIQGDKKKHNSSELSAQSKKEKSLVEKSLKILKVLNFLYSNQDLITDKGIRFLVKQNQAIGQDGQSQDQLLDFTEPGFSDLDLISGFKEIKAQTFHHHKLDSYLQKSIKDPYNLVQGAISSNLQQIFQNCPFLFPFATKQLYFKLISFISSIDVHRSIFFLRQYIKQSSGTQKMLSHEKDNIKKIARQKVQINREKLIPSALQLIQKIDKRSFLEIEFQGEEGSGLGPTLEFYDNIADEFKNWKIKIDDKQEFKMWRLSNENLLFPSPICIKSLSSETIKQIYEIYRLAGTIVAKAIVDDRQIDLPISPLFWKLCLGHQMTIFDIQKLDDQIFNTLAEFQVIASKAQDIEKQCEQKKLTNDVKNRQLQSLTLSNGSKVADYCLYFTLPCFDHIELIQGGKDRAVDLENAQDFVDLVLHYTFHETIKIQMQAFKKGFNAIFPISSLAPFTHTSSAEEELETMVCGINCDDQEWTNKEDLMKNIEPEHGYNRNSQIYLFFIRYITEIPVAKRPLFLKFLTGSKRLPIGGFKSLNPHLTFVLKKENPGQVPDSILPSVMACQNYVKCPMYSSYEVMKQKFDYAVLEGQQNFTLS